VAEIYDCFTYTVLRRWRSRFLQEGEGGPFAASGATDSKGRPVNTNGGMLSEATFMA